MKRGFTILELLVASILLATLVTILTMIFDQSSIAWRVGIDSQKSMKRTRLEMSAYHDVMDDALPGVGDNAIEFENRTIAYRTVSVFRNWSGSGQLQSGDPSGNCQGRAVDKIDWSGAGIDQFDASKAMMGGVLDTLTQPKDPKKRIGDYIVGVRSAGPNRQMGDDDDITTYPEDVD